MTSKGSKRGPSKRRPGCRTPGSTEAAPNPMADWLIALAAAGAPRAVVRPHVDALARGVASPAALAGTLEALVIGDRAPGALPLLAIDLLREVVRVANAARAASAAGRTCRIEVVRDPVAVLVTAVFRVDGARCPEQSPLPATLEPFSDAEREMKMLGAHASLVDAAAPVGVLRAVALAGRAFSKGRTGPALRALGHAAAAMEAISVAHGALPIDLSAATATLRDHGVAVDLYTTQAGPDRVVVAHGDGGAIAAIAIARRLGRHP